MNREELENNIQEWENRVEHLKGFKIISDMKYAKKKLKQLKKQLEELPKLEVVIGNWYWAKCNKLEGYLIQLCDGSSEYNSRCWFTKDNIFVGSKGGFTELDRPATDKEVETALIAEAKKRGFKEGARFKSVLSSDRFYIDSTDFVFNPPFFNTNTLCLDLGYTTPVVFDNGKWSEIIKETTIHLEGDYTEVQLKDILNNKF